MRRAHVALLAALLGLVVRPVPAAADLCTYATGACRGSGGGTGPTGPTGSPGPTGPQADALTCVSVTHLTAASVYAAANADPGLVARINLTPPPGVGHMVGNPLLSVEEHTGSVSWCTVNSSLQVGTQRLSFATDVAVSTSAPFPSVGTTTQRVATSPLSTLRDPLNLLQSDADNAPLRFTYKPFDDGPIATSAVSGGGINYAPGDTGTVTFDSGDATYVVDTVGGGGAVTAFHLTNPGTCYDATPSQATTAGGSQPGIGTGFTVTPLTIGQSAVGWEAFVTVNYQNVDLATGQPLPCAGSAIVGPPGPTGATGPTGPSTGSGAEQTISFQPGLLSSVVATKAVFGKFALASTVDNLVGSALTLTTCTTNPTITFYECGTDASCASPTTIGSVTVTATGQAFDGTVSSGAIGAGHYVGWAFTAGTCAAVDAAATAQVHAN